MGLRSLTQLLLDLCKYLGEERLCTLVGVWLFRCHAEHLDDLCTQVGPFTCVVGDEIEFVELVEELIVKFHIVALDLIVVPERNFEGD